jgi:hypothetical protein
LLYSIIGVLVTVILPVFFLNLSIPASILFVIIIVGFVSNVSMLLNIEKFPGPHGELVIMTFAVSSCALMLAGAAFLGSTRDSEVLQKQLTELQKISQILESKE